MYQALRPSSTSTKKARPVSHVGEHNLPVYAELEGELGPEDYPPCPKPCFLPGLTNRKVSLS